MSPSEATLLVDRMSPQDVLALLLAADEACHIATEQARTREGADHAAWSGFGAIAVKLSRTIDGITARTNDGPATSPAKEARPLPPADAPRAKSKKGGE